MLDFLFTPLSLFCITKLFKIYNNNSKFLRDLNQTQGRNYRSTEMFVSFSEHISLVSYLTIGRVIDTPCLCVGGKSIKL